LGNDQVSELVLRENELTDFVADRSISKVLMKKIVIATRRSPLAVTQTEMIIAHLRKHLSDCRFEMLKLSTTGDRQRDWSLEKRGGKGLFTTELEEALLRGDADLAMHSTKDLPTEMAEEFGFAGFLPRDDARDVLVMREGVSEPKILATGSPRRRAQARLLFPDVEWQEIRGNVETRLQKIADGEADGTILARAGLQRLGIESWPGVTFRVFETKEMVPAVGQGAVAVQSRAEDVEKFASFFCEATRLAITVERTFLAMLGGGCQTAYAGHYTDGIFEAFHESTGYRRFKMPGLTFDKIEAAIEPIVEELR